MGLSVQPISGFHMNNSWVDFIGSNDGTATGATFDSTNQKLGSHSGKWDGINDRVICTGWQPSGSISVFMWVRLGTQTGGGSLWRPIFCNALIDGTGICFTSERTDATGLVRLLFDYDLNGVFFTLGNMGLDTWAHIGLTWDESTETLKTYVNGSATTQSVAAGTLNVSTHDTIIGASPDLSINRFCDMLADELIVFDQAVPQADVDYLYNGGAGREVGVRNDIRRHFLLFHRNNS
jgi:hypothetical protein